MNYRITEWDLAGAKKHIERKAFTLDENGVARWKSNGCTIMDDMAQMFEMLNVPGFSRENTAKERNIEDEIFITEYKEKMKNHVYSEAELNEMRRAFGPGKTVIDILTGEEIKL